MTGFDSFSIGNTQSVITGIAEYDNVINELTNGLHLIKGDPAVGKSAFAIQVATDWAEGDAFYLNCEMMPQMIFKRVAARKNTVKLASLIKGTVDKSKIYEIDVNTKNALSKFHLINGNSSYVSAEYLRAEIDKVRETDQGDARHLVVLDSFDKWVSRATSTYSNLNIDEVRAKLARDIADIAREYNLPIIVICQTATNFLDYEAETVTQLSWELDGKEDESGCKRIKFNFVKNRNGEATFSIAKFNTEFQDFI
jgi:predicted ATP-dependent serine protease